MAALDRSEEKLTMGQLSERLLVSNGNVTVLINRLVEDGIAQRYNDKNDKRIQYVSLTKSGKKQFRKLAHEHETLIDAIFENVDDEKIAVLLENIGDLAGIVQANLSAQ